MGAATPGRDSTQGQRDLHPVDAAPLPLVFADAVSAKIAKSDSAKIELGRPACRCSRRVRPHRRPPSCGRRRENPRAIGLVRDEADAFRAAERDHLALFFAVDQV